MRCTGAGAALGTLFFPSGPRLVHVLGGEHLARLVQARGQPCQDGRARGEFMSGSKGFSACFLRVKSIALRVPRALKVPAALLPPAGREDGGGRSV